MFSNAIARVLVGRDIFSCTTRPAQSCRERYDALRADDTLTRRTARRTRPWSRRRSRQNTTFVRRGEETRVGRKRFRFVISLLFSFSKNMCSPARVYINSERSRRVNLIVMLVFVLFFFYHSLSIVREIYSENLTVVFHCGPPTLYVFFLYISIFYTFQQKPAVDFQRVRNKIEFLNNSVIAIQPSDLILSDKITSKYIFFFFLYTHFFYDNITKDFAFVEFLFMA